jgi:hypothetical protein
MASTFAVGGTTALRSGDCAVGTCDWERLVRGAFRNCRPRSRRGARGPGAGGARSAGVPRRGGHRSVQGTPDEHPETAASPAARTAASSPTGRVKSETTSGSTRLPVPRFIGAQFSGSAHSRTGGSPPPPRGSGCWAGQPPGRGSRFVRVALEVHRCLITLIPTQTPCEGAPLPQRA